MATNTPAQQQKPAKEEMWLIQLAKSKIVRAFAVSCELMLFLGGLWVTLTVNEPDATKWAIGPVVINTVVMTAMGWAVDAALGESWLHVVIQHVKKETGMEKWSKAVAGGISLLFAANIVYALVARDAGKTDATQGMDLTTIILFVLTALRIFIGFIYITVRECQGWITRHKAEEEAQAKAQQQQQPQTPAMDVEQIVNDALAKQASEQTKVIAELKTELAEVKQVASLPQILPPPIDPSVLVEAATDQILRQVEAKFEMLNQHILRQTVVISEAENEAKSLPQPSASSRKNEARHSASNAPVERQKNTAKLPAVARPTEAENIIRLVPAFATRDELKAEAIRLHEDEGLSSYEIGEKLGKSAKTVQNWLKKNREEAEDEAESEVIETAN